MGRALSDDLAAMNTGTWTDVHKVVGGEHHVFVVFDDNHRVACIAKRAEAVDEFAVVPLMKPDARFI